jgi:hypothetical protein
MSEGAWVAPWSWDGNVKDPDTKTHFELSCHSAMLNVQGAKNVVGLRSGIHRALMDNDSCSYRLYTAWNQHRDLQEMINHYQDEARVNPAAHIPEVSTLNISNATITTMTAT